MIKNDDLLALPRAVKPAKAMRAAQEHARPCTAPGVICAKVHETADGPVLALDLWARGGLYAREFFDGQGKRRVFFWPDGESTTKGLFKAAGCHTLAWASRADGKRMEAFFNIPRGITRGAEEMIFLAEHGRRGADGTFTASGAGNAGGYAPEELFSDRLPEGWQQYMQERGLEARHVLLMESVWKADPLTGIRERMDKCTCSACGAVRYEWRGEYENRTMTGCGTCGAHCMAVRKRNGKLPYEADGSLLWFHRHKDTAVAQGYEVNYWVGNDAVEHWAAVPSHIYAWGPYGDYAFNRYQSWCMGRQRAYLDQWYAQARMLDNWPFRGVPVLMAPEEGALNGTPLENARLRGYAQAKQRCLYPVRLATIGRRLPVMEGFCDFEDWDTVLGICAGRITLKRGETKPHRALGLTRPEYDRYRAEEWPWDWLPIYAAMKRSGYEPGLDDLQQIVRVLQSGGKLGEIERLEPGRLAQVWRYLKRTARRELDRQMRHGCGHAAITEEEALRHTLNMWLDYRRLAAQAGAANHPDRDSAMPYDLFARHDRLVEAQKEKERAQQAEREKANAEKFTAMWERIRRADWQEGAYSIRAAKSTQELVDEGHALHHCVGGYTQNVLAGRVIFFIRRADEPDVPFFTLNLDIKSGQIIQLLGKGNCHPPEDVKAWAEKWRENVWMKKKKAAGKAA